MALVLTVETEAWQARIETLSRRLGSRLLPVVKGNGYGLGRAALAGHAQRWGALEVAVGTVAEVLPDSPLRQLVLTPSLDPHLDAVPAGVTLTVGSTAHADAATHAGPVAVKLRSSMLRYGVGPDELSALLDHLDRAGRPVDRFVLHLPLAGTDDDRLAEIETWLPELPGSTLLSVSHLEPERFEALADRHTERPWQLRVGTALWHGDKRAFHLGADVLEVRPVEAGALIGYHQSRVPGDGHVVAIGAGSAQGVFPLADGRSPFHFAQRRLGLIEPPHMHTSLAFVPAGEPCPAVGEVVDVQRPLTQVAADRIVWIS